MTYGVWRIYDVWCTVWFIWCSVFGVWCIVSCVYGVCMV
jgi:hypothetical protein